MATAIRDNSQETTENNQEKRVLVYMPTGRDTPLVCATLNKVGIEAEGCSNARELEEKIAAGAGTLLIAEEALQDGFFEKLIELSNSQPVWSDLPVVLFTSSGRNAEKLLETVGMQINATIVERPIRVTLLISAVRAALRARDRQYEARDLLSKLEEADHQKDLFLATLSHELRTPLHSILGWIQLLRKTPENEIDKNYVFDIIERNARAQSEIISDILFVSRVITGKFELKKEIVDLVPAIKSAIDVVRPMIETRKLRLTTVFDPNLSRIDGDFDRLRQVFWNLLSNAVKFTPTGGSIDIRVENDPAGVKVEICDSGQGIKPEFLPFVFERFRQADSSFTRKAGGLGLGLAIVRHLVEMHGGTVSVTSDGVNCGSVFKVILPVSNSYRITPPSENGGKDKLSAPEMEESRQTIRVLLIEDDDDSREMLEFGLRSYGMQVTAVASATEGLKIIAESPQNVLVSDVGLPEEDGYQLIKKVRQLASNEAARVPAIALTGYVSVQDREQAINAGYQEHLGKPVDLNKLVELIGKLTA